jgi:hypothetical protein
MLCNQPDRDVPKLKCGYPLPCPHHTVVVDLSQSRPVIELPMNVDPTPLGRVAEVARALKKGRR